ncbi:MAG: PA14 domain-containing protein, partial [Lentisphaeraceae bacterium]|nr:PA14 domain-containing protein [Lentisphaeraceae bacterium]
MSIKLDPATAAKIEAFGQRRRKLILLRGACTFITITLLGFGLVGLIDYLVFMDDWVRYILSTVAYIFLAIALYFTCLRQLTHKSTIQELALMFEMAAPSMKEKLLSAVELSEHGKNNSYESNIFKDAIQRDVAAEVEMIELESILPKNLILKWTRAAIGTFAIFAVLLLIPNLKFGILMLRAVIPTANVDRVSNIEITLIEPGNTDSIVPEGDAVSIVIEISDPDINTAYLESELDNGQKDTISMQKISENRFSTVINVGRDDISFRLRAHTALTKFYTLRAVPRPQAIEFEKQFTFPSYSGLKPSTVTEKKGDIRILEGTTVDLAIKADQPVEEAELRFENVGGKKWTVPLTVTDQNILKGRFKVDSNANYKVHIVSKESGFKNKFSPKYDVQSLADLLPSITMTLPKTDLSLPANEVIDIRGNADDDLGLKEIFLSYKHNSGTWQNSNIINTNLKTLPISYKWELTSIKAEPGDEITFRLGARDRKGNEGFSSSIRLNIVADGFDQNRMTDYREFTKVQKALKQLVDATQMNLDNAGKNIDSDPLKAKQKFIQLAGEIDNSVNMAEDVLDTIKRSTAKVSTKTAQSDLVLVGRVVSYIKNSMLSSSAKTLISAVNEADKKTYSASRKLLSKGHTTSEKLSKLFKVLVAGNGSQVISADIYTILEEQKNLNSDSFQQNVSKEQVVRRQQSLMNNVENTFDLTAKVGAIDKHLKNHYKHVGEKLEWTRKKSDELIQRGAHKTNGSFTVEFFADDAFRKKKHENKAHNINNHWGHSPAHQVPNDYWSARWTGSFMSNEKGKHTFLLHSDGGVRLWVDEKLVVNDWIPSKERDNNVEIELEKDQAVRIRLDYREDTHNAIVRLQCRYPNNQVHDVRPSTYERFHFHEVENRFAEIMRDMNHATRVSGEQSQNARRDIRKLLEEESEAVKDAAKDLEELAKAEDKLDKAIQEKKPEEVKKKLQQQVAEKTEKAEQSLENAIAQLEERAQLEEMKKEADSQFVEDMAKTAQALESLKDDNQTNTEKASEKAEKLAEAIEDLEKGHELKEAQKDIEQMIANEKNDEDPRKKITENPELFKKAEEAVKELREELAKDHKDETSKQMAEDLQKALHDHETNQARDEMRHREHADKENREVTKQLEKMQEQIAKAEAKLEEKMKQAREAINEESPSVGEQLEKLAQEARKNQQETAKVVDDINEAKAEEVQQKAKEMQKKQEVLNDKLEEMRKALRRQANAQDTSSKEGLEKARDADDALAMLQQPPPKAEELLSKAANSDDKVEQLEALEETNAQQNKIADALEKLSKHFNNENVEELADSREELRKNVEEMAAENQLAEEYDKAEALADSDQKSIDEQIAEL